MPTVKRRINISLPREIDQTLGKLAKRDDMPEATKALELIRLALQIEEDAYFEIVVRERLSGGAVKWIRSNDAIWK